MTALLEYLDLGILKIFGGWSRAPFDPPVSAPDNTYQTYNYKLSMRVQLVIDFLELIPTLFEHALL